MKDTIEEIEAAFTRIESMLDDGYIDIGGWSDECELRIIEELILEYKESYIEKIKKENE